MHSVYYEVHTEHDRPADLGYIPSMLMAFNFWAGYADSHTFTLRTL